MKALLLIILLLPLLAISQIPEPIKNSYVHDYAKVLKPPEIEALNQRISTIEKSTSVQIAVVLINKLPEKLSIEDYTLLIGRKWKVGNYQNGLVYVASFGDKKQRLEVAAHLQGDIPDIVAQEITDNVKLKFRQKDYEGMINVLLDGIHKRIDPSAKEQLKLAELSKQKRDSEVGKSIYLALIIILFSFIGLVAYFIYDFYLKKKDEKDEASLTEGQLPERASYISPTYIRRSRGIEGLKNIRGTEESSSPYTEREQRSYLTSSETETTKSDTSYGNYGNDSDNNVTGGIEGGGATNDL